LNLPEELSVRIVFLFARNKRENHRYTHDKEKEWKNGVAEAASVPFGALTLRVNVSVGSGAAQQNRSCDGCTAERVKETSLLFRTLFSNCRFLMKK
jgi:hypothetical protein